MRLSREAIAALLPHAGAMCLLDAVSQWDARRIRCVTASHLDPANPLRADGRLPAVCGLEYAAQAMAVHGALVAGLSGPPRRGYLVSARDVVCRRGRLDDLPGELVVEAEQDAGDRRGAVYDFRVTSGGEDILSGRAAVVLGGTEA